MPKFVKLSLYGSRGHEGELVKADSIVRFTNGIKCYIVTAMDCGNKFAFAYAYANHSSTATGESLEV